MVIKIKLKIFYLLLGILIISIVFFSIKFHNSAPAAAIEYISERDEENPDKEKAFIKWVDFSVPYEALDKALKTDINSLDNEVKLNWIELLAYTAAKNGGNFSRYKNKDMDSLIEKLNNGESIEELTKDMKYYDYFFEAYTAVLDGFVGHFQIEVDDPDNPGERIWVEKYGLKAFSPIASGYGYNHYDDFGNSRDYGFRRVHLGNDLMGNVGTPIIAIESGTIEALGWNRYGGWRIGIRSLDNKRYYYYAHLRKDFPYTKTLQEGDIVYAGDVIGYLGRTGYSSSENANNINVPHLHLGLQLIFDESQKDSVNEIWIDVYNIVRLLKRNQSATIRDPETDDYHRAYNIKILD